MRESSRLLHQATDGRAFIRSVNVVLPASWTGDLSSSCRRNVSRTRLDFYSEADVKISSGPHPLFSGGADSLWTQQSRECGQTGDYISAGPDFFFRMDASDDVWIKGKFFKKSCREKCGSIFSRWISWGNLGFQDKYADVPCSFIVRSITRERADWKLRTFLVYKSCSKVVWLDQLNPYHNPPIFYIFFFLKVAASCVSSPNTVTEFSTRAKDLVVMDKTASSRDSFADLPETVLTQLEDPSSHQLGTISITKEV